MRMPRISIAMYAALTVLGLVIGGTIGIGLILGFQIAAMF